MRITPSTNTRLRKAVEVICDPTHPQHRLLVDLIDTAIELDPPASFVESDRPRDHLTVVPWNDGAA